MKSMSETFDLAQGDPRSRLVEKLRCQVRGLEAAALQEEITFSTGTPALDQLLGVSKPSSSGSGRISTSFPFGGVQGEGALVRGESPSPWRPPRGRGGVLHYGMLVEWLSGLAHSGAATLSLLCAREACRLGGALVVIDRLQTFYPPAAAAWGIDLNRLIIVRPRGMREALWATLQSLRSPAVAAVWVPLEKLDSREFRQLQLAAQTGRTLGLLLRPAHVSGQPSWADVRLLLKGRRWRAKGGSAFHLPPSALRLIEVHVLRQRGARPGRSIILEINDATHTIQEGSRLSAIGYRPSHLADRRKPKADSPHALPLFMAPELADPATRSHPARA
jgi:hypothetical protein